MPGNSRPQTDMSQRTAMTDVTVIGLGRMGATLARALVIGGRSVSVWNRDASKAHALRQAGAHVYATLEDALRASSHIVVCVTGYTTWTGLLNGLAPGVLDGSILGFPSQVGAPQFPASSAICRARRWCARPAWRSRNYRRASRTPS